MSFLHLSWRRPVLGHFAKVAVPSRATATSARPGLMIYVAVVDFQSLAMDKNR